jgi:LAO/AO transport system kinase
MINSASQLFEEIQQGNHRSLARGISYIENGVTDFFSELKDLPPFSGAVIGVTGPPGAGKSTLVDALIGEFVRAGKKIAVLCVDPSSSFHSGALLGDRIRMSEWYNHPDVFIRSLGSRGSLGGLHPGILSIVELLKAAGFDHILVETVGVGQNEIEIAALADVTLVVLVPEAGDEIQTMKAGLMEIADVFVVNKSDRPDADLFVRNLRLMLSPAMHRPGWETAVVKTVASQQQGLDELMREITRFLEHGKEGRRHYRLLAERAYHLIRERRMKDVQIQVLEEAIAKDCANGTFNLYQFVAGWDAISSGTPG